MTGPGLFHGARPCGPAPRILKEGPCGEGPRSAEPGWHCRCANRWGGGGPHQPDSWVRPYESWSQALCRVSGWRSRSGAHPALNTACSMASGLTGCPPQSDAPASRGNPITQGTVLLVLVPRPPLELIDQSGALWGLRHPRLERGSAPWTTPSVAQESPEK